MTRGISDPAPIQEPEQSNNEGDQPTNQEVFAYLDDLSDFIREIDIRLATIEKFVIQAPQSTTNDKEITKKKFFTASRIL